MKRWIIMIIVLALTKASRFLDAVVLDLVQRNCPDVIRTGSQDPKVIERVVRAVAKHGKTF